MFYLLGYAKKIEGCVEGVLSVLCLLDYQCIYTVPIIFEEENLKITET